MEIESRIEYSLGELPVQKGLTSRFLVMQGSKVRRDKELG